MNYRGYQYDLKTPMVTTSADVSDLRQCVQFAKESYPRTPVYALGFSMGANSLVKMLGEVTVDPASLSAYTHSPILPQCSALGRTGDGRASHQWGHVRVEPV